VETLLLFEGENMKKMSVVFLILATVTFVAFQNCSKPVSFSSPSTSVTPNGDPDPNNPGDPNDPDIIPSCATSALQTKIVTVSFPFRQDCAWNQNGNLGRVDRYIQARSEESMDIALPAGSTLCDMEFEFHEQTFEYDDHVILALNNRILMTTAGDALPYLSTDGSGYLYDWSKLVGKSQDVGGTSIYCNGGNSNCSLPQTDVPGTILLNIPKSAIQKIMTMSSQSTHQIKLITTGDNDDHDCRHEAVSFQVKATYHN
jgi:hypothetical protein